MGGRPEHLSDEEDDGSDLSDEDDDEDEEDEVHIEGLSFFFSIYYNYHWFFFFFYILPEHWSEGELWHKVEFTWQPSWIFVERQNCLASSEFNFLLWHFKYQRSTLTVPY